MSIYDLTVIGVGRLGGAIALALSRNGYTISQLVTRNAGQANQIADLIEPRPKVLTLEHFDGILSDVIFICTQDSEIAPIGEILAEKLEQMPLVFHTSGALSSDVLSPLQKLGCEVASFHPLVSVSDPIEGAASFADAYFCLEGDKEAVFVGKQIVETLGGKPFSIETRFKPLYHASAVMACGHLVTLISAAVEMFSCCGIAPERAQEILLPLIQSTINNLQRQSPAQALTGTFARTDLASLEAHLRALGEYGTQEQMETYLLLGRLSLELARRQGADDLSISKMNEIIRSWTASIQ
jgi:predicted short-subunit dehydrogenase-like oxidoreductase (DUF2520 family)